MTIGALLVYLLPERFRDIDVKRHLWRSSVLFSVSLAVCFVTQLAIPFSPHGTLVGLWSIAMAAAAMAFITRSRPDEPVVLDEAVPAREPVRAGTVGAQT